MQGQVVVLCLQSSAKLATLDNHIQQFATSPLWRSLYIVQVSELLPNGTTLWVASEAQHRYSPLLLSPDSPCMFDIILTPIQNAFIFQFTDRPYRIVISEELRFHRD